MRRIKIPQYEFALKMQGGLCARWGVFAGHYGICTSDHDLYSFWFAALVSTTAQCSTEFRSKLEHTFVYGWVSNLF